MAAISGERKTCSRPVKSSLEVLLESRRSWGCQYSTLTVYTHLRLVDKVPNFQRYETARIVATLDGTELPYYRIFDIYFDDMERLQSSLSTPEGQARTQRPPELRNGVVTIFISEVDS